MSLKKPKSYGKSVCKHKGYSIRIIVKTAGKNEPSGKYGIYAGKNKVEGSELVSSIEDGIKTIDSLGKKR
jgi:hypothetical protein